MAATAAALLEMGHRALHLTVVETNTRALAFYKGLGGTAGVALADAMYGHPVRALPVRWSDLSMLRHAAD